MKKILKQSTLFILGIIIVHFAIELTNKTLIKKIDNSTSITAIKELQLNENSKSNINANITDITLFKLMQLRQEQAELNQQKNKELVSKTNADEKTLKSFNKMFAGNMEKGYEIGEVGGSNFTIDQIDKQLKYIQDFKNRKNGLWNKFMNNIPVYSPIQKLEFNLLVQKSINHLENNYFEYDEINNIKLYIIKQNWIKYEKLNN